MGNGQEEWLNQTAEAMLTKVVKVRGIGIVILCLHTGHQYTRQLGSHSSSQPWLISDTSSRHCLGPAITRLFILLRVCTRYIQPASFGCYSTKRRLEAAHQGQKGFTIIRVHDFSKKKGVVSGFTTLPSKRAVQKGSLVHEKARTQLLTTLDQ